MSKCIQFIKEGTNNMTKLIQGKIEELDIYRPRTKTLRIRLIGWK